MKLEEIFFWWLIIALIFQLWWWFCAKPETKEKLRAAKRACDRAALKGAGKVAWWAIKKAR